MSKVSSTIPFNGTPEQEAELMKIIASNKSDKGALMQVLHSAQELYGYLPIEVQKIIAKEMDIPLEKIYGVVTFYSQFSLKPKGKYTVSVCLGTACYVKGAGDIFTKLSDELGIKGGETTEDGKFTLVDCRCIGACGLAPVLTVNEYVYGRISVDDIPGIIAKYQD